MNLHKYILTTLLITTLLIGSSAVSAEIDGTDVWEEDGSMTWVSFSEAVVDPSMGNSVNESGRTTATYVGLSGSDMEFEVISEFQGETFEGSMLVDRETGEYEKEQTMFFMDVEDLDIGDPIVLYISYQDENGVDQEKALRIDGETSYSLPLDGETEEIDVWVAKAEVTMDLTRVYAELTMEVEFSKSSGTVLKSVYKAFAIYDNTEILEITIRSDAIEANGVDLESGFFDILPLSPIPVVVGILAIVVSVKIKRVRN